MPRHRTPRFLYRPHPDASAADVARHPVVVVGAGPVGLTAAIDLAAHGVPAVLLDEDDTVSPGSRAVCYAKRTLEIWDRLGAVEPILERGVRWKTGRVFFGEHEVCSFDLLRDGGHAMPAFVNVEQYALEEFLVGAAERAGVDLRWRHRVRAVAADDAGVRLEVETPDGTHALSCDYLVCADGARSRIREMLDLPFEGQMFPDRFAITDVVMKSDLPAERRFWFDAPFNPGRCALMHMQPGNLWRLDFQLGPDADPREAAAPEAAEARVRAMLGPDTEFEIEWISVYAFQCRRLARFRHGRVLFAGDAAHQVSPFGARGANSGVQDVDNLMWKLRLVLEGTAPEALLDTYDDERVPATDENILNSTRATEFVAPPTPAARAYRDAVLTLADAHPFARSMVNSGRLSAPAVLRDSPLVTPDADAFAGDMVPGAPCADAPVRGPRGRWLLDHLGGEFRLLVVADGPLPSDMSAALADLAARPVPLRPWLVGRDLHDDAGLFAERYDARPGTCYLIRPDQHVAARWRRFDAGAVRAALDRSLAYGRTAP